MSAADCLKKIREASGMSMYALNKALGFKSGSHVWAIENGRKRPSVKTCYRIIEVAKQHGVKIKLEMLLENENDNRSQSRKNAE